MEWRTHGGWSGPNIPGSEEFVLGPRERRLHVYRAFWLASRVETSGRFGAVNAYDGCGMTCGLDQKTAILPKTMKQGGLWRVIRRMWDSNPGLEEQGPLEGLLQGNGYVVSPDGFLRCLRTGNLVSGQAIRDLMTPPRGVVPREGPWWDQSKTWAEAFHTLFANPSTFAHQVSIGVENLVLGQKKLEEEAYYSRTRLRSWQVAVPGKTITPEEDLAFCVYHAYSVHAPSLAAQVLREEVHKGTGTPPEVFSKSLIRAFGTHPYKRWKDQPDNKASRYDRTRVHAMRSGLWSQEFFKMSGLMPENLDSTF